MRSPTGSIVAVLLFVCAACAPATPPDTRTSHPPSHASHQGTPAAQRPTASTVTVGVSPAPPPGPAPDGMVWIPGGTFWMGCESCGMPDALPVHAVTVAGFWMDRTPVTNVEFGRFVAQTRYVTVAERPLDAADFPGVPAEALVPGSAVFRPTATPVPLDNPMRWWHYTPGASWKHPEGPGSSIAGRGDHPMVHVAFEDVSAYAQWAGKRLPSEAEFEFAARGGRDRQMYSWGNEPRPGAKTVANTWQGRFPARDLGQDGYTSTSPVTAFPPNDFGLHDMGGNVWQWCADWYRADYYATLAASGAPTSDPRGPASSVDPDEPAAAKRVIRGGSFLCSEEYCARFLVGSRGKSEVASASANLGFRLVRSATTTRGG